MNRFFGITSTTAAAAVLLCCVTALVTGCTSTQFSNEAYTAAVPGAAFKGVVHGGQNPISSATVQLWAVGASGYGSAAAPLGSSVTTGPDGSFTLGSYTCPAAPSNGNGSTYVYITSSGGNPGLGTGTNANIMLAAGLGSCSSLSPSTYIVINEVTTAATAYALGQYFTPAVGGASSADSFGAPNTTQAQVGMANAMGTINNLVTTSNGTAVTSATLTGTGGTITTTPESAKLNTIADILAACVNSAGGVAGDTSNCGMLFDGVVTASGTAPTDTLQAAVYMSLNPTSANSNTDWPSPPGTCSSNICALYALASATPPFVGVGVQPADWTVGILYSGPATSASTLLDSAIDIAADSSGNIWVLNYPANANDSIAELSPTGTPLANPLAGSTAPAGLASASGRNLAVDLNNNVWIASSSSSSYVFEWMPSTSTALTSGLGSSSYGIAIDGNNNVFIGKESSSAVYSVQEFPGANISDLIDFPLDGSSGAPTVQPEYLAVDTSGNVWLSGGTATDNIVELSSINTSSCTAYPCTTATGTYTTVTATSNGSPYALAAGVGGIWAPNINSNSISFLSSPTTGSSYGSGSSLNAPHYAAVDGSGNVWVSNKSAGAVAEFSSSGTLISNTTTSGGYAHNGIGGGEGIAIDPSGNVWVANEEAYNASLDPDSVFEIVGAASPTVTPIALALKNSAVGAKP